LDSVYLRFKPPNLTSSTVFVPVFRGWLQTAAFPVEIFRACLSAAHAKDAVPDPPTKESQNSEKLHPELLPHRFPWAKQT